jgi:rare lipoprotein A
MIIRLRRFGLHSVMALTLMGFSSSTAVQAVELQDAKPLAELEDVVAAAVDPAIQPDVYEMVGQGEASYYGNELAGNRTASGERFNPSALTAAHRSLPLGTKLRVTNKANGRSVLVRVNDRGPFARSRVLDLSLAAAREIRMVGAGKAQVTLEVLRRA